jgi:hypothetical protein
MNYKFKRFLERLIIPGKILGIVFVLLHLWGTGIAFNPLWVVFYLGLIAVIAVLWFAVNYLLSAVSKKYEESLNSEEAALPYKLSLLCSDVKRRPWLLLLIPGEDGIFFLPLLYVGLNPFTAFVSSALFALAHAGYKSKSAMFGTFLIAFVVCLAILPNGIIPVIIGHFLVDITVFLILIYMERKEARARAESWQNNYENYDD